MDIPDDYPAIFLKDGDVPHNEIHLQRLDLFDMYPLYWTNPVKGVHIILSNMGVHFIFIYAKVKRSIIQVYLK